MTKTCYQTCPLDLVLSHSYAPSPKHGLSLLLYLKRLGWYLQDIQET